MDTYKIKDLLPYLIDNTKSGQDLKKWYALLSSIKYKRRRLTKSYLTMDYSKVAEFYKINFNIDISEEHILSLGNTKEETSIIKAYTTLLMNYINMGGSICDSKSLGKLLLYDIKFLLRLSNMYNLTISFILSVIITDKFTEYMFVFRNNVFKYESVVQTKYEEISINNVKNVYQNIYIYNGGELSKDITNISVGINFSGKIPDHVTAMYIYKLTLDIILPSSLVKLKCGSIEGKYVLPESIKYLYIGELIDTTLPRDLVSLMIDNVSRKYIDSGRKLPSKLKALTILTSPGTTDLPKSLIYLDIRNTQDISHLSNLKALIYNTNDDKSVLYPPNIEYLNYKRQNTFTNISSLKKLKYLIFNNSKDTKLPLSLEYLATENHQVTVPSEVKYLSYNNRNSIPKNVETLIYLGKEELNIQGYKKLRLYVNIMSCNYGEYHSIIDVI